MHVWLNELLTGTVHEVGDGRAAMSRYSWNWIIKSNNQSWKNISAILLLEIFSHIVTDLTDAMEGSVSYLWVWMLQVLEHSWHHGSNVLDILDILSNLRESHQSSILVSPVALVGHHLLHEAAQEWKALGLADC